MKFFVFRTARSVSQDSAPTALSYRTPIQTAKVSCWVTVNLDWFQHYKIVFFFAFSRELEELEEPRALDVDVEGAFC